MGWVHRHKRRGATLALIALALQIALAFGHVHLRGPGGDVQVVIASQTLPAHSPGQSPAQNPGDDNDYCAICASIVLASSAFAPAPPQLLVPANFQRVEIRFNAARPTVEALRLAFRSRAPPVA